MVNFNPFLLCLIHNKCNSDNVRVIFNKCNNMQFGTQNDVYSYFAISVKTVANHFVI